MKQTGLLLVCWTCIRSGMCDSAKPGDQTRFLHNGYEYRAIMEGIEVDKFLAEHKSATCHTDWAPLPEGHELVPDTPDLRKVLTAHTWSTHVVVLSSMKGYTTFPPHGTV